MRAAGAVGVTMTDRADRDGVSPAGASFVRVDVEPGPASEDGISLRFPEIETDVAAHIVAVRP